MVDAEIDTNLLNLIHYKELVVTGSYGPKRSDMATGLSFCNKYQEEVSLLVEGIVSPYQVQALLPSILNGERLKCVVNMDGASDVKAELKVSSPDKFSVVGSRKSMPPILAELVANITGTKKSFADMAQKKVDLKTKTLGALGRIETLAVKISTIQETLEPEVDTKRIFGFAGDHGVVEEGVSAFPAKVTVQMVENF